MYANKDVFGFVAYGNGGSSSNLSSLSPLAPPFTVDRSVSKINSSPLVDFNVTAPLNSSAQNWVPSHYPGTGPSFYSNTKPEFDSIHSSNAYSYLGPESISLPCVNHAAEGVTNDCGPCIYLDGITTSVLEAQPYYPSYVLPAVQDDGHSPIPKQRGYDLSSTSRVSTLKGSFHDDHIQSSEYPMGWDSMWSGLGDCKQVEFDGSIHSKEMNAAGVSVHQNHMNKGTYSYKGSSTCEDAAHNVNALARDVHTGSISAEQVHDNSFTEYKPKFKHVDNSKTTILGASVLPEIHPQAFANSRNYQIPYDSSCQYDLGQEDFSMRDVALSTNFSPASVIRLPAVSTGSLKTNAGSTRRVNIGKDTDINFVRNSVSCVTESSRSGVQSLFDVNQLGIHQDTNFQINTESSINNELSGNNTVSNDGVDRFLKEKFEVQVPLTSCGGYSVALGDGAKSSENFTENNYTPAEDSPCWRGSSFPYFSPSEISGAVNPCVMQSLEASNGLNLHDAQFFSCLTNDISKVSLHIPGGNTTYPKNELPEDVLPSHLDYPSDDYVLFRECRKGGGNEMKKEWTPLNESIGNSDSRTCENFQYQLEESKFTSEKRITPGIGTAETAIDDNDVSESGSSNVSSIDGRAEVLNSLGGALTPKLDVQTLVNTMHNLSDLLLFRCSNGTCELKEEDCEILKNLISNLDTCILKKIELKSPEQGPEFHPQGTFQFLGDAAQHHKGLRVDRPKAVAGNTLSEIDNQKIRMEKQSHIVSGKKDDKFSDLIYVRNATSKVKDDKMTQAIQKVLSENFSEEEETQSQALLYKNLWLEAEATLCSINYRDRFNRMKIRMENCKSNAGKEAATNVVTQSSCKTSPDITIAENLTPEAKVDPTRDIAVQKSHVISTSDNADDVMARFHILKSRVGNPSSMNTMDVKSNFLPDLNKAEIVGSEAKDSMISNICIKDPPSSKTSNVDNSETSVMARFHILKCRVDNSSSNKIEGQVPIDSGFSGKKKKFPFIRDEQEDANLDVEMEPYLQHNKASHSEDRLRRINEFHMCEKDYPPLLSVGTYMQANQLLGGRNDSSSSDWEHVLKEELSD